MKSDAKSSPIINLKTNYCCSKIKFSTIHLNGLHANGFDYISIKRRYKTIIITVRDY